ncbi:hypothetical protein BG011_007787 [Mortierella polycephala]|uniref:DDT domain-containing protein n=1 Tax=Mortierella polycephala TaxID=41804 RepID=A0A9P6PSJ7_9FUNG|nr:hypothetical protein BG011_007787 [Mortierella polycephala]
MSSPRPVRTSARQATIKQQQEKEQEALLAAKREHELKQRQEREQREREKEQERIAAQVAAAAAVAASRNGVARRTSTASSSDSSRSLSSAPSDSDSASLDSNEEEDEEEEEKVPINNKPKTGQGKRTATETPKSCADPTFASSWEIALVYGFLAKFRPLLRQICPLRDFTMEELESGLLATSTNECIEEIHANLLSNMLNRKKAVDSQSWQKVLSETLDAKLRTGELEFNENLMKTYNGYYNIPPLDRVQILRALVDWVLQEGPIIRQGIDQENDVYMVEPFGVDQARRVYWYFGGKETKSAKKKNVAWETVAANLEELKALADAFQGSSSKSERALQERLQTEIIEPTEERILQKKLRQERQEKRMLKLAELHQMAATRTTRTRSSNRLNVPKYTFDDEEDEGEEEFVTYTSPSSRRGLDKNESSGFDSKPEEYHGQQYGADHQEQLQWERSGSVDQPSSGRSSVGRDSDTSIRDALQRARVGDDDYEDSAGSKHGKSINEGKAEDDQEDEYKFEDDLDDDETLLSKTLETPLTPASVPVPASAPAPRLEPQVDIEMESAEV